MARSTVSSFRRELEERVKHALPPARSGAAPGRWPSRRRRPSLPPREARRGGGRTWREPEPPREVFLILQGLDKDGTRSHTRVPLGEFYEFDRLPPGSYHLIGGVETEWLWDLRFTVEAGQEMVLDLSRENSTSPKARV